MTGRIGSAGSRALSLIWNLDMKTSAFDAAIEAMPARLSVYDTRYYALG
jgi:hypothetical protein